MQDGACCLGFVFTESAVFVLVHRLGQLHANHFVCRILGIRATRDEVCLYELFGT